MFATFALLTLAILGLWLGCSERALSARVVWPLAYAGAVVAALAAGIAEPIALLWIAAFAGAAWTFSQPQWRAARAGAVIVIVVIGAGLMTHQLPGFNNPRVITAATFSADAIAYRLHLNFDKPVVGLFLLAWCHERMRRAADWREMLRRTAPIAAGLIATIMILALAAGYVRFEPKFPREAWLWAWVNLCFTCVAEEAFFRGFVQAQLQQRWRNRRHGAWLALAVAAVLFGVAHAAGGPTYVALATVAGAGYGWAFLRTGRIEASILTHFALNATHFLLFTYPALHRG